MLVPLPRPLVELAFAGDVRKFIAIVQMPNMLVDRTLAGLIVEGEDNAVGATILAGDFSGFD